jgi:hypothetical protein
MTPTEWSASIRCVGQAERQATAATPSLLTESGSAAATARVHAQTRFCVDALGDRTVAFSYDGGVALARTLRPSANLLTGSGGGHSALERCLLVAQQVTLYLVEVRVPGGHAC